MNALRPGLAVLAVVILLQVAPAATARGQGHTPDPYNIVGEYNRQYEPYMYATVPTMPGVLPNQDRLQPRSGVRGANRFQSALDGDDDGGGMEPDRFAPARLSGPGVPYYRANRQYDREFQRNYRPNELADRSFYSNQQQRNDKYFQALRETDARKRGQLLREYNLENVRAARSLSAGRTISERDRDRELNRDKFGPGGLPLAPDDEPATPPARRASPRSVAPSRLPNNGTSAPAAPNARGASRTAPRLGMPSAPSSPSTPRARPSGTRPASGSASDVLERSELLDRARASVAPGSAAPAPPAPR